MNDADHAANEVLGTNSATSDGMELGWVKMWRKNFTLISGRTRTPTGFSSSFLTCPPQIGPRCVNAFQADSRRRPACRRSGTVQKRSSANCEKLTS